MSKTAIITANYARLPVFKIFAEGIRRLRKETGQSIPTFTSGSIDAIPLCKEYDINFYAYPNQPLTGKFNNSMEMACTCKSIDSIMILGSDNIISTKTFLALQEKMDTENLDMAGVRDLYMFGLDGEHSGTLLHYTHDSAILGVGRIIKKSIIQGLGHPCWNIDRNKAVDSIMLDSVRDHVKTKDTITGHVFDLKSNHNMNRIDFWERKLPRVEKSILWENIGHREAFLIKQIVENNK